MHHHNSISHLGYRWNVLWFPLC